MSVRVSGGAKVTTKTPTNPATQAEADALLVTNKYISPKTLKSLLDTKQATRTVVIQVACSDLTTSLTTGLSKAYFRMPYALTLTEVRASLLTAGTVSGVTTIDINEAGTTILSTKLTIDFTAKTSVGAATPAVISDAALADDAIITIDIDVVTGGAVEKGLIVTLIGNR